MRDPRKDMFQKYLSVLLASAVIFTAIPTVNASASDSSILDHVLEAVEVEDDADDSTDRIQPALQIEYDHIPNETEAENHDSPEPLVKNILLAPLGEDVELQDFFDADAIDESNDIVEVIVQFVTPPAVALRLMHEERIASTPLEHSIPGTDFEAHALAAHNAFNQQLSEIPIPSFKNYTAPEIFSEHHQLFNGVYLRVSEGLVEQIAALPEVYAVFPHILPAVPEIEVSETSEGVDAPATLESTFFNNANLIRETRDLLNIDDIHYEMGITGHGVRVALLSTGIDHSHPEFVRFLDETGRIPGWQYFYQPGTEGNHGTLAAGGLIAMAPEIELWSIQKLTLRNPGLVNIAALEAAVDLGADVIYSFGNSAYHPFHPYAAAVTLAVLDGHIVVAAPYDEGITIAQPLSPLAIAVGANNQSDPDHIANFPGQGPVQQTYQIKPDIVALGVNEQSTSEGGAHGASVAGSVVTGIVALLAQEFPDASPCEIKARLMNTAQPLDGLNPNSVFTVGAGLMNPVMALQSLDFVTVAHNVPVTASPNTPFELQTMASLSFGNFTHWLEEPTITATIRNNHSEARTYTIDYVFTNNPNDLASLSFAPESITIEPNSTGMFITTLILTEGSVPEGFYEGYVYVRSEDVIVARLPFAMVNTAVANAPPELIDFELNDDGGYINNSTDDFEHSVNRGQLVDFFTMNVLNPTYENPILSNEQVEESIYIPYTFNWGAANADDLDGQVEYNETPQVPSLGDLPRNPGYRFDGWTPMVGPVTEDTTFEAIWQPIYVTYTFEWGVVGVDNPPEREVRHNTTPSAPAEEDVPTNPGYTFGGWSPAIESITENTTFEAIWEPIYVSYTFEWGVIDVDNLEGRVRYNTTPQVPSLGDLPSNPGYRFDGWTPVLGPIVEDTTFQAIWQPIYVTYIFDWGIVDVDNLEGEIRHNTVPTPPAEEDIPLNPGFRFDEWTPIVGPITENTTFNAVWTPLDVDVYVAYIFDWGVEGIANPTGQVSYDTSPIAPTTIPTNPGYRFDGWTPLVDVIVEDTTFTALWTPILRITVEIVEDEAGNIIITLPPNIEYEISVDGEIVIPLPLGTDAEDIDIIIPHGWEADLIEGEVDQLVLIITPSERNDEINDTEAETSVDEMNNIEINDIVETSDDELADSEMGDGGQTTADTDPTENESVPEISEAPRRLPIPLVLPETGAVIGLSILGGTALTASGFAVASKKKQRVGKLSPEELLDQKYEKEYTDIFGE